MTTTKDQLEQKSKKIKWHKSSKCLMDTKTGHIVPLTLRTLENAGVTIDMDRDKCRELLKRKGFKVIEES